MLHRSLKAVLVYAEALFLENFLCEVEWKSVCIIQLKCRFAAQRLFICGNELLLHIRKYLKTLIYCLIKLALLVFENLIYKVTLLIKLRIAVLTALDNRSRKLRKEKPVYSEHTAMSCGTSDDFPKDISASLIRRHYSVGNHKRSRTYVISDKSD